MTDVSRRQLGALLGATLLAAPLNRLTAHEGPHAHRITIRSFAFDPDSLTIRAGATVEWLNDDIAPHTATETHGARDTGRIDHGGTGRITFERPGVFDYHCAFHPHMRGRIDVTEPPRA